ncbi:MAG: hypothetical protein FWE10_00165 [Rikenellaceae bacterium]|nr:hypothetical protein [Rikenellaceae bacterium]MCL2692154.1 hypothetical protein [Rikenellaceae bacterium]
MALTDKRLVITCVINFMPAFRKIYLAAGALVRTQVFIFPVAGIQLGAKKKTGGTLMLNQNAIDDFKILAAITGMRNVNGFHRRPHVNIPR